MSGGVQRIWGCALCVGNGRVRVVVGLQELAHRMHIAQLLYLGKRGGMLMLCTPVRKVLGAFVGVGVCVMCVGVCVCVL